MVRFEGAKNAICYYDLGQNLQNRYFNELVFDVCEVKVSGAPTEWCSLTL